MLDETSPILITCMPLYTALQHLNLMLPRLKMFYLNAGNEVELEVGAIIDRHEHPEMVEILIKRETRTGSYALGEKVRFDASEFHEIAFACHMFAGDLASKLPVKQTKRTAT